MDDVIFSGSNITLVIRNAGNSPVEDTFWVDAYIDPQIVPTQVNQRWDVETNSKGGAVWGLSVANGGVPLAPGGTRTLTLSDAYYFANLSDLSRVAGGEDFYVQVDAFNNVPGNTTGAVLESHERSSGPYNNIDGPRTLPGSFSVTVTTAAAAPPTDGLPRR